MKDLVADFWIRFNKKWILDENGCWAWNAAKGRGYGVITYNGKAGVAHKIAYELLHGKVKEGLELDHLCKNTFCVNPSHLEQVTHSENCRRGTHGRKCQERGAKITHCPQGHEYSGDNLYIKPNGHRECRQCVRDSGKRYREKNGIAGKKPRKSSLGKAPRKNEILNRVSYINSLGDLNECN